MDSQMLRKRGEAVIGLILAALGVGAVVIGRTYPGGSGGVPGSDVYPVALGVLLAIVGISGAIAATRSQDDVRQSVIEPSALALIVLVGLYAVAFEPVGFVISTFVFLFVAFRFVGKTGLTSAAIVAAVATAVMWGVFVRLLGVGLPGGVLG